MPIVIWGCAILVQGQRLVHDVELPPRATQKGLSKACFVARVIFLLYAGGWLADKRD